LASYITVDINTGTAKRVTDTSTCIVVKREVESKLVPVEELYLEEAQAKRYLSDKPRVHRGSCPVLATDGFTGERVCLELDTWIVYDVELEDEKE
jgi:hypothetical protein